MRENRLALLGLVFCIAFAPLLAAQETERKPARLKVLVPAVAQVLVDDRPTSSTGAERLFVSPPLTPGMTYTYQLKATWLEASYRMVRMADVKVQAGTETVVDLRPGSKDGSSSQILYVPTPDEVVARMLEMAKVGKGDVVFDLGCGDGRIVVTAATKHGARGVGIDLDPDRVKESLANVEKAKVKDLVEIRQGDALKVEDLERATVVMLYMLPEFMRQLRPIVLERCKPGTRIVAHDYPFPDWQPLNKVTLPAPNRLTSHTLYLWVVGEKKGN